MPDESEQTPPRTLALVDDHPSIRRAVQLTLQRVGFGCRAYASAEGFLCSNEIAGTSCLLLDVQLEGMSGPDLQQKLAELPHRFPIIFITSDTTSETENLVRAAGAAGYLRKPVHPKELVDAILKVVGRYPHHGTNLSY